MLPIPAKDIYLEYNCQVTDFFSANILKLKQFFSITDQFLNTRFSQSFYLTTVFTLH